MAAKIRPIEERRHSHGDDDTRRRSAEERLGKSLRVVRQREPGTKQLFDKSLEQRRLRSMPQRKEDGKMIGPLEVFLCLHETQWNRAVLELRWFTQDRKIQLTDVDSPDLMACCLRGLGVAVCERVNEVFGFGSGCPSTIAIFLMYGILRNLRCD